MSYTSKLKQVVHFEIKIKGKCEAFGWHWEEPSKQIFGKSKFLHPYTIWNQNRTQQITKRARTWNTGVFKVRLKTCHLQVEIVSSQVFFMWRTIFNVSQFLLFPPLLAHQTPHPYSVESYLPIRPLIIQNTEHLSGSWFYTLFMLGEEESAKHRNHLNSNFMVDRKSKCTDANFQVALFLYVFCKWQKQI